MKKRLLSLLCACMLLAASIPFAAAQAGDTQHCADTLTTLHLLPEIFSDQSLTTPATRAEAAVLLVRLSGMEQHPDTDGWFAGFQDLPQWAAGSINFAARRGWVSGVSKIRFDPSGALSANAWCAMLLRMLGYSDAAGDFAVSDAAAFAWRIGLTHRELQGALSRGDVAESTCDALRFCYKDSTESVIQRLIAGGVCTGAAASALGLLTSELTARQTADRYLSAGFQLVLYRSQEDARQGNPSANASGFFIRSDGLAVTNYHAIRGALSAAATLMNGESYPVERVLYYDPDIDIAVLKVSQTSTAGRTASAFNFLEVAGTADICPGDTVYAIGNPLGYGLVISSGIIGSTGQKVDRYALPVVVNSADISQGSSGGALINVYGQVIAVTSGAYTYGNNMFLAVPADPVLTADLTEPGWTLAEVAHLTGEDETDD